MKHPRIPLFALLVLTACALLTGCGSNAGTNSSAPAESEVSVSVSASASSEVSTPVETAPTSVPFTETDSFPFPFSEELALTKSTPQTLYLTREQAQYDYDTLWQLLEENYPYFDAIREEKGLDYRTVRQEYQAKLNTLTSGGTVLVEDFWSFISDCLYGFYPVGHLYMIEDPASFFSDWPRDSEKYNNLADIGTNEKSATVYSYLFREQTSYNSPGYNRFDKPDEALQDVGSNVSLSHANGLPYIKLSSMKNWTEDTTSAVADFLAENRGASDLIIDIRGNGGGSDAVWRRFMALLRSDLAPVTMLIGAKAGSLNQYINPYFCTSTDRLYIYTDDSWQAEFPGVPADGMANMDIVEKLTMDFPSDSRCIDYKGKIWVLINRSNYSAADSFTYACKQLGFATMVGETTRGNGIGMQPHVLALPWSGFIVYYEPYIGFNPDGSCNGITGTQPDYEANAVTALAECLKLIEAGE